MVVGRRFSDGGGGRSWRRKGRSRWDGWRGCGAEISALLIEMAFDGGCRSGWMAADLGRGEFGPRCEVAGVDGGTPSGQGRREHGGMVVGDLAGNSGGGLEERVGDVEERGRRMFGGRCRWRRSGGELEAP